MKETRLQNMRIYSKVSLSPSALVWPGGLDLPARLLTGGYLIKSALN